MRGMRTGLGLLMVVLVLAGCRTPDQVLKPPKLAESYTELPDDPRYQNPPQYPAETMKRPEKTKDDSKDSPGLKSTKMGMTGAQGP